ncbi:MAG TPA: GTPase Era [Candidatus Acidoferrales bacterium]|nr:GTPase Era [Candidatus Acidoferrales bacterium]
MAERGIHRCGRVALVGRPNVGKSSLLNRLLGQKISIVTHKAQTTRHRILGIHNLPGAQIVFIDTPGIHRAGNALGRYMVQVAWGAVEDADIVVLVSDAARWTDQDQAVLDAIRGCGRPLGWVLNKIDRVQPRSRLLALIAEGQRRADFTFVVPFSAMKGDNIAALEQELVHHLPVSPPAFEEDIPTDRSERFLAGELLREQLLLQLHEELPYGMTVEVERFARTETGLELGAVIWVMKDTHKGMVIGRQGEQLKRIGRAARLEISRQWQEPVFLSLWVKVRENWADEPAALTRFGYD